MTIVRFENSQYFESLQSDVLCVRSQVEVNGHITPIGCVLYGKQFSLHYSNDLKIITIIVTAPCSLGQAHLYEFEQFIKECQQ